ncbi:hypothetical protein [Coprobacter tertius]|uniref:Lipoprotein n=1 Tax=Coprobacter tertius TaxID=2944915 RepID=A0ABT1MH61_9BACT|nr:hypothetical protein [Coprobacter tertius]MCP9611716.1 hypothetical protein [Coprobacter tertius]
MKYLIMSLFLVIISSCSKEDDSLKIGRYTLISPTYNNGRLEKAEGYAEIKNKKDTLFFKYDISFPEKDSCGILSIYIVNDVMYDNSHPKHPIDNYTRISYKKNIITVQQLNNTTHKFIKNK